MKIFYAFLIIVTSVILFMLPFAQMVYDFRTDQREDEFTVTTGAAETTANVTLLQAVYGDDTGTITFTTNETTEVPAMSTYNTTSRQLLVSGLTVGVTRLLDVTYDVDTLSSEGTAINDFLDRLPAMYLLIIISFPVAALAAIFLNKA